MHKISKRMTNQTNWENIFMLKDINVENVDKKVTDIKVNIKDKRQKILWAPQVGWG